MSDFVDQLLNPCITCKTAWSLSSNYNVLINCLWNLNMIHDFKYTFIVEWKKKWNYMSLKPFNFWKEQLLVTISSFNQMHQIRELRTKMRMFDFIFFVLNKFRSLNTMPPWKAFSWFWRLWRFVWDFVIHSWFRLPVSILLSRDQKSWRGKTLYM